MTRNILYKRSVPINSKNKIQIRIPSVGEILEREDEYYALVSLFTAMPIDYMVQLYDAGIDFTTINEWEMFLMLFGAIRQKDLSMIFEGFDFSKLQLAVNEENQDITLVDPDSDIRIDRAIHSQIAVTLRKIHGLEKNIKRPANDDAKEYMIERARKKMNRHKNKVEDSRLESLIIAMVNTEQFKYDFEGTLELSIFQFNESVRQVVRKVDYDNRMYGVYAGTISVKDLNPDDLSWLTHKK